MSASRGWTPGPDSHELFAEAMRDEAQNVRDLQVKEWADRHGFEGHSLSDLRAAFEDAATSTRSV